MITKKFTPPNLGVGIGLRPAHIYYILNENPKVDFFEIISENFMVDGGLPISNLEKILEKYPVVQHGVSMSIASIDPLNFDYLKKLKALTKKTKTPWFSDHLCYSSAHQKYFHDLLPFPYTEEIADYIVERIKVVQDYMELPFAIENLSSYISFKESFMTEWEFFQHVVEKSGCYILLDVNNIFVSSVNHNFSPEDYLAGIDLSRVLQIHLAGHTIREDGILLDTHNDYVRNEVWDIYQKVYKNFPNGISTLLEWDDNFIPFQETHQEALKAKNYQ